MKKLIIASMMALLLALSVTTVAFAVPAHVHTADDCQNLANGQLNHGVHVAHGEADAVISNLCGH